MGRLSRQALFLTIEKASHLTGGMVLLIAVARLLGADALGAYAYVIALTAVAVPVLDAGLNTRAIARIAEHPVGEAVADAMAYKLCLGPFVVALVMMISWALGKPLWVIAAVGLVGLSTVAMSIGDALNAAFKGGQRAEYSALLVGGSYFLLALLGVGAMVLEWGVLGVALAYAVCRLGYLLAGWWLLGRKLDGVRPILRMHGAFDHLGEGLRFLPAVFFLGTLLNLSFVTTDWLSDGAVSGAYAIGYRVASALFVLGAASMEGVLPSFARVRHSRPDFRRLVGKATAALLAVGVVGTGLVQVLARPMTLWVFGPAYDSAVTAVRVLGWTLTPFLLCALFHTALLALGQTRLALRWMLMLVVSGTALGAVGYGWNGALGTALAPTVSAWIFAGVLGGCVRQAPGVSKTG